MKHVTDAPSMEVNPSLSLHDLKGEAPSLKIGDKVTAIITGKVTEVSTMEGYDKKKTVTHTIRMERLSVKILKDGDLSDEDIKEMSDEDIAKRLKEAKAK